VDAANNFQHSHVPLEVPEPGIAESPLRAAPTAAVDGAFNAAARADLQAGTYNVYIFPDGGIGFEFPSVAAATAAFAPRIVSSPEAIADVLVRLLPALAGQSDAPRPTRKRREPKNAADRNLITVAEFAAHIDCAESSVFELLKLGLPSIKSPKIGRRILKSQAEAWLLAGGAERSRTAKRLRKANGATNGC